MSSSPAEMLLLSREFAIHADGYLVLGQNDLAKKEARYYVGWMPRNPAYAHMLCDEEYFEELDSARAHFDHLKKNEHLPIDSVFDEDWQQYPVYAWEERESHPTTMTINRAQAKDMVEKIAEECAMPAPRLIWQKHTNYSDYDFTDHTIRFGHRDSMVLLHEMAHALYHHDKFDDVRAAHGPAFVMILIDMYARFGELDREHLLASAGAEGLTGDLDAPQIGTMFKFPAPAPHAPHSPLLGGPKP